MCFRITSIAFALLGMGIVYSNPVEATFYALIIYVFSAYQMTLFICGQDLRAPYIGESLIAGKDGLARGMLFGFYLFLFSVSIYIMAI